MKKIIGLLALTTLPLHMHAQIKYPATQVQPTSETFFGTTVTENFRWLEKEESEETKSWVKVQNNLTDSILQKISNRKEINKRLNEIWNYEKRSTPFTKNGMTFYFQNDGMQNHSVLYCQYSLVSAPVPILDPNLFSKDGTSALTLFSVSDDNKYAVVGISESGSDWNTFKIFDLYKKTFLPYELKNIKFSGAEWYKDGFFYNVFTKARSKDMKGNATKIYYHKIGTSQENDSLVYEDKGKLNRFHNWGISKDKKIFMLSSSETTSGNTFSFKEAGNPKAEWIEVYNTFNQDANFITSQNGFIYLHTNAGAPNGKVIAINIKKPSEIKVIIPESKNVLTDVIYQNGYFVAQYLVDVKSALEVYSAKGQHIHSINLPKPGIVSGLNSEESSLHGYFTFTSYLEPSTIYQFNAGNPNASEYWRASVNFNADEFETKQVFYYSKDSTKVPMYLTYKKGTQLNGTNPVFLYGYGGFNISVTPSFSPTMIPFLEKGGIYAVANIRGGGEYGLNWYKAGTKLQKQNVFDDFIAAAEFLIAKKYTNSSKIAICGGSNGGLLVGATMTQRPDLMKVALPSVGVLDMLHYHNFTIGYAWANDYGKSDNKEEFEALIKYSPLHNIKNIAYPATLVTTADHDDRVVPAHSYKFISELQKNQKGKNPVLIRIDINAGHGAGKPTNKKIEEWTDIWAFTMLHLGMK